MRRQVGRDREGGDHRLYRYQLQITMLKIRQYKNDPVACKIVVAIKSRCLDAKTCQSLQQPGIDLQIHVFSILILSIKHMQTLVIKANVRSLVPFPMDVTSISHVFQEYQ